MKYFQTDDRDDYFDSLKKNKPERAPTVYEISKDGELLFTGLSYQCKVFCRKLFQVPGSKVKHGKWRDLLTSEKYEFKIIVQQ